MKKILRSLIVATVSPLILLFIVIEWLMDDDYEADCWNWLIKWLLMR